MSVRSRAANKAKATKLGISLQKIEKLHLPYSGCGDAAEWHSLLGEFLATYKDAKPRVEIDVDGYDGYPDNVVVSAVVDKTDQELINEIKSKEDLIAAQKKKIEDKERAELERLEAKYRKKS
jgi:hypothetical protein